MDELAHRVRWLEEIVGEELDEIEGLDEGVLGIGGTHIYSQQQGRCYAVLAGAVEAGFRVLNCYFEGYMVFTLGLEGPKGNC